MTQVHSHADRMDDGRLSAPAAVRNAPAIVAALAPLVPETGTVLEIAAGTGEHAVALARAFPGLDWQPTDIDPARLASIDAWRAAEGVANMRVAVWLDATTPDWAFGPVDAVYLSNLFHLLPEAQAENLIRGVGRALGPGGTFYAYGPFRVGGGFRAESDEAFHERLRESDPSMGYKDAEWIEAIGAQAGLRPLARIDMPANNLILAFQKV